MLNRSYEQGVVGLSYLSLIYGIIKLQKNESVILINENDIVLGHLWSENFGRVEREILRELGNRFDILSLVEIDKYLSSKNMITYFDDKVIEFGPSAYLNLKELIRKLPDVFSFDFVSFFQSIDGQEFDEEFYRIEGHVIENSLNIFDHHSVSLFEFEDGAVLKVITEFIKQIKQGNEKNSQLHFLTQIMFQSSFSTNTDNDELTYLIISFLSKRYQVKEKKIVEDLLFEYRKLGGDIRLAQINDWGLNDTNIASILLSSVDGIIRTKKLNYFGEIPSKAPFVGPYRNTLYLSIDFTFHINPALIESYLNKRIVFMQKDRVGSDFPYWELTFNDNGDAKGTYSYAEYQGTKKSFYYNDIIEIVFEYILFILPGYSKADLTSQISFVRGHNTWLEYSPKESRPFSSNNKTKLDYLEINGKKVNNLEYCGSYRANSMGLLGYTLDLFSRFSRLR